jgi:hypothetical protein
MIRHIVMFKFQEFENSELKMGHILSFEDAMQFFVESNEAARCVQVDLNANPAEEWDAVLTADFDSWEQLAAYASHPDHDAVLDQFIRPYCTGRACVDIQLADLP